MYAMIDSDWTFMTVYEWYFVELQILVYMYTVVHLSLQFPLYPEQTG